MPEMKTLTINNNTYEIVDAKGRTDLGAHTNSTENPHNVTAEQVGARPNTWMPTASDVGARPNTWMPTASDVGARPNTWMPTPAEVGSLPAIEDSAHPGCYYRMVDGVQEWINPPLELSISYRTTERYKGLPVYIKALELDLSTSGHKYVGLKYGLTNIVSIEGSIFKRSDSSYAPVSTYSDGIFVNASGNLFFSATIDGVAHPIVKYTM